MVLARVESGMLSATDEVRAALKSEASESRFDVWPENAQAVAVFCRLGTQWRTVAGVGAMYWQGLRYEAVEPVLRLSVVPRREWSGVFRQLRVMESAALGVLNAKR